MSLTSVLDSLPEFKNDEIAKTFVKGYSIINNPIYKNPVCSISGGSDSDIMLDIVHRVDEQKKVIYVWFDTGLEYKATKEHLKYLEDRYNIKIERERAVKPIPVCVKEYGQPFLSKYVSEYIGRLQNHGFDFVDKDYDEICGKYGKCNSSLKWWCNVQNNNLVKNGNSSRFNIEFNKYLKEFLIANPPKFKISDKCCTWAKKKVAERVDNKFNADLSIIGVRKAEGGKRAFAYKNCYTSGTGKIDSYRPLFWFINADKEAYEKAFDIKHSDCYTKYGFKRTGCACCPFGRELEQELSALEIYEPNMYKAVNNIFKDSFEYTKKYKLFAKEMKEIGRMSKKK